MPAITRFCSSVSNSLTWRGSCAAICTGGWTPSTTQGWRAVGLIAEAEHAHEVAALLERGSSRVRYSTCTPAPP